MGMKKLQRGEISPSGQVSPCYLDQPLGFSLLPASLFLGPCPLLGLALLPPKPVARASTSHLLSLLLKKVGDAVGQSPCPVLWQTQGCLFSILDSTILSMRLLTPSELSVHCRASVTNKYSPALHSSLKHQLKYLCYQIVLFSGPKCPWGPVYGSRCLQVPTYESFG